MKRFLVCVTAIVFMATLAPRLRGQTPGPRDDARLPDPLYPDVLALWEAGSPAGALTALDRQLRGTNGDSPIEAQLLRARLLSEAGEYKQSAELWEGIRSRERALDLVALRAAADNYVRAGSSARAEQLLAGQPARPHGDLLAMVATTYRVTGQLDRAIPLYRKVIADPPSGAVADEAALSLATSLDQAGDRNAALSLVRGLQLRFRQAATFARARALLFRLAAAVKRDVEPYTEREYQALTERLRDASAYDGARAVLEDWKKAYPSSALRVEALVVDTLYRARSNEEARSRANAFLAEHPDSPQVPDVRILQYRLDVREGRTDGVRSRGQALWTGQVAGVSPADRLSLGRLLAAYLVSVGQVAEGLDVYQQLYRASTSRELRIDILWRSAVAAIRAGQLDRADSAFRTLRDLKPGPDTSLVADYWTAIIADRRQRRDQAVQMLTDLARRAPYDYYGIRARERLVALGAPIPSPQPDVSFPSPVLRDASRADNGFRSATLLARAGLKVDAAQVARALAVQWRNDAALALLAARASAAAGDHRQAVRLVESRFGLFLERPSGGRPEDFLMLAYPQASWKEVRAAADSTRVDPLLLLSLARQESRFDPTVRSPVGALGLFQIMPYRADELGPRLGLNVADRSTLLRPNVSAILAAHLVSHLLKRFNNEVVAAIAAYNADEERVEDWRKAARGVSEDLFVDTIPYTETRTYVRTVYSNYVMYRQLYGQTALVERRLDSPKLHATAGRSALSDVPGAKPSGAE